jgi:hypothetical protein
MHTHKPRIREAEAEGSGVQNQLGLLSHKKTKKLIQ